jgi:hypothetical protein
MGLTSYHLRWDSTVGLASGGPRRSEDAVNIGDGSIDARHMMSSCRSQVSS